MIVAAYAEQEVIADRVANLRALDYPADRLEVIVACDGSPDDTAQRARDAGADLVLELPRGGKVRAQDAGVRRARHEIIAVLGRQRRLGARRAAARSSRRSPTRASGTCAATCASSTSGATNQEGLYWRYEMAVRSAGIASALGDRRQRRDLRHPPPRVHLIVDPIMGHDLSFPFNMVKRGWRAVYAPDAHASEKMVPTIEGEFAAQAADDEPRLADHAPGRDAVAARTTTPATPR